MPNHYKRERHREEGEAKARTIRETLTQGLLGSKEWWRLSVGRQERA